MSNLHILLVADGRSAITRRWLQGLLTVGYRVSVVSTFPCQPLPGVEKFIVLPVAFGAFASSGSGGPPNAPGRGLPRSVSGLRLLMLKGRYLLGPLTLPYYGAQLRKIISQVQPDIVHALRIPYEGMLAAYTPPTTPLIVSIWGNDLTLHASGSASMGSLTAKVLERADGLIADAQRDIRLGREWGFAAEKPALVVPGNGGIDLMEIERIRANPFDLFANTIPAGMPLVVNPRGIRPAYVRNDVFFQAIPLVLERHPEVTFVCPAMAGQEDALKWVRRLKLQYKVRLLHYLPQAHLWDLFVRAEISVSISQHDGMPNTLLEAMACNCFPVVGDLESIREWITPGVNGLLVEPTRAQSLADAILVALEDPELRRAAAAENSRLIRERAEVGVVRRKVAAFYDRFKAG